MLPPNYTSFSCPVLVNTAVIGSHENYKSLLLLCSTAGTTMSSICSFIDLCKWMKQTAPTGLRQSSHCWWYSVDWHDTLAGLLITLQCNDWDHGGGGRLSEVWWLALFSLRLTFSHSESRLCQTGKKVVSLLRPQSTSAPSQPPQSLGSSTPAIKSRLLSEANWQTWIYDQQSVISLRTAN